MNKEQKERIKKHLDGLRSNEQQRDEALEDFVIEEIADRVKLYLNADEIEPRLERIVARIVVASLAQAGEQKANGNIEQAVQSISDNGQSISYKDGVKNYYASATDSELLGGFAELLAPYRRANVAGAR